MSPNLEAGRSENWNDPVTSQGHSVSPKFKTLLTASPGIQLMPLGVPLLQLLNRSPCSTSHLDPTSKGVEAVDSLLPVCALVLKG